MLAASVRISANKLTGGSVLAHGVTRSVDSSCANVSDGRSNAPQSYTGPIPTELGQLAKIKKLELYSNRLTGTLRFSLSLSLSLCLSVHIRCASRIGNYSLPNLVFDRTQFCAGPIPTELGCLAMVEKVELYANKLSGRFLPIACHKTRRRLSRARCFDFELNLWIGPIPTELGQLGSMYRLDIKDNMLSGMLVCCGPRILSLNRREDSFFYKGICVCFFLPFFPRTSPN